MKKIIRLLIVSFLFPLLSQAQVGINIASPEASAMLDITSTTKGLLIPRIALTSMGDATTIPAPATSLLVYNTGTAGLTTKGFYYNSGTSIAPIWTNISTSGNVWSKTGNAGTLPGTNFLGTIDNQDFCIGTFGSVYNIFTKKGQISCGNAGTQYSLLIGEGAGNSSLASTGGSVTFIGYRAGYKNLLSSRSAAFGYLAMGNWAGTGGGDEIAIGYNTLSSTTSAQGNVAIGSNVLFGNQSGFNHIAIGSNSSLSTTTGYYSVSVGVESLQYQTTGYYNTAAGYQSLTGTLATKLTGHTNCALGYQSLKGMTTGYYNIGIGTMSASGITTGQHNIAIGSSALLNNKTGLSNIAIGFEAGKAVTGSNNIIVGYRNADLATGSNNIFIGNDTDAPITAGSNQLNIGNLIFGTAIDGTNQNWSTGNIGIGISNPTAKLTVAGTVKLGINGTELTEIIKTTVNKDIANHADGTEWSENFAVANSQPGSTVTVSNETIPPGISVLYAYVSVAGTVSVGFKNNSGAAWDPVAGNYFITVIK